MPTTIYTAHVENFQYKHTTTDTEEAQAWADAGIKVTAETKA